MPAGLRQMAALELLINEAEKRAVRNLFDRRAAVFPDVLPVGDVLALQIGVVNDIQSPWDGRRFDPLPLNNTTFRVALGNYAKDGGQTEAIPAGGTFTLTFEAQDATTQTTAEIVVDETAGIASVDIADALNSLSKVQAAGSVDVNPVGSSDAPLQFRITFRNVGVQNLLTGFAGNLFPVASIDAQRAVTGNATTREVQILRIVPNAIAFNVLNTAVAAAGVTITNPQDGGAGVNEQFRVQLTGPVYGGSWTFSKTSGTTGTTAAILAGDTVAQIRAKLEAATGIGAGNVSVAQEGDYQWLIEFIGALANTAITAGVNGGNLVAIPELSGSLDLRTPACELLLDGEDSKVVNFEVEKMVGAGPALKILERSILITRAAIDLGMFPNETPGGGGGTSLFGSSPDIIVAAAGTTSLSPGVSYAQWIQRIKAQAGAGPYTAKFALANTLPIVGAVYRIPIEIVASANPTIEFYDGSTAGTLLQQLVGDTDNPQYRTAIFVYQDDAHWHFTGFES